MYTTSKPNVNGVKESSGSPMTSSPNSPSGVTNGDDTNSSSKIDVNMNMKQTDEGTAHHHHHHTHQQADSHHHQSTSRSSPLRNLTNGGSNSIYNSSSAFMAPTNVSATSSLDLYHHHHATTSGFEHLAAAAAASSNGMVGYNGYNPKLYGSAASASGAHFSGSNGIQLPIQQSTNGPPSSASSSISSSSAGSPLISSSAQVLNHKFKTIYKKYNFKFDGY